jgi:hypothetical protein
MMANGIESIGYETFLPVLRVGWDKQHLQTAIRPDGIDYFSGPLKNVNDRVAGRLCCPVVFRGTSGLVRIGHRTRSTDQTQPEADNRPGQSCQTCIG